VRASVKLAWTGIFEQGLIKKKQDKRVIRTWLEHTWDVWRDVRAQLKIDRSLENLPH
jgi:hypothetical protein